MSTKTSADRLSKKAFLRARVNLDLSPGEMVRVLRELQELTQSELSALSGISQSNLSAIERGTRQIGRERALVLAQALKVHPAVILFPSYESKYAA